MEQEKIKLKIARGCCTDALGDPSPAHVCAHMNMFTHVTQVPRGQDNLKEFTIFIVVSFYLQRFPKERRGWAGGAVAGDTAWNQEM